MNREINIITGEETQYPLSAEELAAQAEYLKDEPERARNFAEESVRTERNAKLSTTDWTQVADAPADKAAWATYRQSLRALPEQAGFPNTVTWPTAP